MSLDASPFVHDFAPGAIHYGRGCVSDLGGALADRGLDRAVVVCGRNVGANRALMDPVEAGLGDRLAAVFDETTPAKRLETAYDAVEVLREVGADAIVAVGSGSSHDLARATNVLQAAFRTPEAVLAEYEARGLMAVPDPERLLPLLSVPTTFAGADLSAIGGGSVPGEDGSRVEVAAVDRALLPAASFYDPDCFETTPPAVLAGSAMNGFDKAVESVYSRYANPLVDATAVRALRYLRDSLPRVRDADDPAAMERAVLGVVLAQQGLSVPGAYKANVIHAFGHGLRRTWGVQQGVAHGVMAPHVLRLLFERVDGRRDLLAEGLVGDERPDAAGGDPDAVARAVVDAVVAVRDGLGVPTRLRDVAGTDEADVPEAAAVTHGDPFLRRGPEGFEPTVDEVEATLRAAW